MYIIEPRAHHSGNWSTRVTNLSQAVGVPLGLVWGGGFIRDMYASATRSESHVWLSGVGE